MDDKAKMSEIVRLLEQAFETTQTPWLDDPFQVLIATVLSQNTSDRNSHRAFINLRERFDVTPQTLSKLKPENIRAAIAVAGMSEVRSRRIIDIAKEVLRRFDGDLDRVFIFPLEDARGALMEMEGVGPKTADILLSFVGGFNIMPVDTNIFRVVDRIGFAKGRNYERTRGALERLIPPEKLRSMHFRFIKLGREVCKPRNPLCPICPVNHYCEYGLKRLEKKET